MDTDWFRARMKSLKVTQEALGAALRRDRSVISKILSGERPLQLDEIEPLAAALEVPVLEILYRAGLWRSGKMPVIHHAFVISEIEAGTFAESIPKRKPISGKAVATEYPADTIFALRVKGDSMDQIAPEGSIIIVDYTIRKLHDGELGVFRRDGEATFKRFRREGAQVWLDPSSSNPRNQRIFPRDGETIDIIGAVVEIRPDYQNGVPRRLARKPA